MHSPGPRCNLGRLFHDALINYSVRIVHTISNLNISKAYIQTFNSAIFKFIWRKKKDKIKRRVMISDSEKGGLRVPSIDTMAKSLKLAWIPRLLSEEENFEDSWKAIPK